MITALVVIIPSLVGLLEARAQGLRWSVAVGKVECPKLSLVSRLADEYRYRLDKPTWLYLAAFGQLRAKVQLSALRNTSDGLWFDVDDLSQLQGVTLVEPLPAWWRGWREVNWKPAAELPFRDWATAGVPLAIAEQTADLVRFVAPPVAPSVPTPAPSAAASPVPAVPPPLAPTPAPPAPTASPAPFPRGQGLLFG